ncbi:hypothetical protein OG357_05545 [Streptomyces sp. NBC_01255]|uniref:hypothetical protein n=1 Tax=Streptomyces sp. NBC_01255 TaxID=2903798 RepID=UPI002E2FB08F|nr:hypothetical protein [Streptomyces sp. NBC_01255]
MDATDGYPSYPVTVRMNGTVLSGHTNVPIPEDRCCFASYLGFSSEESVESTAIHEAGHAVAGFLVGVPAVPVEVVVDPPCPECGAFRAHGRNASVPLNIASASDTLMVLAAGVQAELLWNTSKGELTPERRWAIEVGGFGDQELAQQVAEATATVPGSGWSALDYGPPGPGLPPWNWAYQQQRALVALTVAWPRVSAIAEHLTRENLMTAEAVTDLLTSQ